MHLANSRARHLIKCPDRSSRGTLLLSMRGWRSSPIGKPRAPDRRHLNSSRTREGFSSRAPGRERLPGHRPCDGKGLPGSGRLTMQALLETARLPTWWLRVRDAAIERRISSRSEATRGALESSGDRNAGTAMYATSIRRQRRLGSEPM